MQDNGEDNNSKKLYRVDWKFIDLDKGVDEDYAYVGAASPEEAVYGINGTDFVVREASKEEIEAYVAGYEDGYDIAIITERFKDMENEEANFFSLDDLEEAINELEERVRKKEEDK
jgi:hypothetical protein